ncbi:ATP-binding protein [Croceitalea sp. MTPC9]|uniref:ATP-binding protein n=1 Tax=unclassified Croceitalea TaxID=2632280 RepID=UPI002B3A4255|nr:ATP-binding protein [Croceitalea sp. MTPC6]GMN15985.1 ATP-binding protein [Croceitalea sp. MTPC9]
MKINLKQAVKYFFTNPSLELVYVEAVANSIDAGATKIDIEISIEEISKPETLSIMIRDNGEGFTDKRFSKFAELMKVEDDSHKGLGRLVFLSYFEKVNVTSYYDKKIRTFEYNTSFDESSMNLVASDSDKQQTELNFSKYHLKKIATHDFVKPSYLKKRLLEEFYPRLYLMKQDKKQLEINITLNLKQEDKRFELASETKQISINEINELTIEPIDASSLAMFENMELHYSITEKSNEKTVITALCIDGRTYKVDIISDENIPIGYEIIFLLNSSYFDGKVSGSRQELKLSERDKNIVKKIFRKKVAEVLQNEIPVILESNKKTRESLANTYPHLLGYFDKDTVGFVRRDESIRKAQEKFFKDQRDVLDAGSITEEKYKKSLELSSRALTEYILYRQLTIDKLKKIDKSSSEADIHNLIVPMGSTLSESNFMNDLYSNNAWLLDDKYMTYKTILSDKVMTEVVKKITEDDAESDNSEPDITLIFSNDPKTTEKVDVVVVELKKRGLKLEDNVTAIVQLEKRAMKLMQYYPNKIQRIWFYAIVEFNDELKLYLENNGFTALFSTDTLYYSEKQQKVSLTDTNLVNVGYYILSLDAFINDADTRNSTFLKILKEPFLKDIDESD